MFINSCIICLRYLFYFLITVYIVKKILIDKDMEARTLSPRDNLVSRRIFPSPLPPLGFRQNPFHKRNFARKFHHPYTPLILKNASRRDALSVITPMSTGRTRVVTACRDEHAEFIAIRRILLKVRPNGVIVGSTSNLSRPVATVPERKPTCCEVQGARRAFALGACDSSVW